MLDLCGGLFVFLLILAVVTLIGHGMWVFLASIFNPPSPTSTTRREPPQRSPGEEWAALTRQLHALQSRGVLSQSRLDGMLELLREQRAEMFPPQAAEDVAVAMEPPPVPRRPIIVPPTEEPVEITEFLDDPQLAAPVFTAASSEPKVEPTAELTPPKPKRDLGSILHAFMEEKNIRWGELISGMLIVGSGIGLVISLWSTLQNAIPYFPALLFMLCTAGIHGAGLYTLKTLEFEIDEPRIAIDFDAVDSAQLSGGDCAVRTTRQPELRGCDQPGLLPRRRHRCAGVWRDRVFRGPRVSQTALVDSVDGGDGAVAQFAGHNAASVADDGDASRQPARVAAGSRFRPGDDCAAGDRRDPADSCAAFESDVSNSRNRCLHRCAGIRAVDLQNPPTEWQRCRKWHLSSACFRS